VKRLRRLIMPLCALGLSACGDLAPRSFDGTWKTNPDQTKFSSEPVTVSLSDGIFDCTSCAPKIHVRADGSDQPFPTSPQDTVAVREIDSRTMKLIMKRNGNVTSEQVSTAEPDGRTLQATTTIYPIEGSTPQVLESTSERIGLPVANANAVTGSWRTQKTSVSESVLFTTFKPSGHELSASWPIGTSWTARFDGRDYPVKGAYRADSVSLKRLNDHTIEMTYKLHRYLMRVDKLTVSDDGKTMTNVSENKLTGRITTRSATRQ